MCEYKENNAINDEELPWLIFTICEKVYAIYSSHVTSIIVTPSNVVPVPNVPEIYLGITNVRGTVYPVLDVRKLFGYPDLKVQEKEFCDMISCREKEHIHWVDELLSSVENNTEFELTTDPHKCEFGKWLDGFCENSSNEGQALLKIKTPHDRLHYSAAKIIELKKQPKSEEIDMQIEDILYDIKNNIMPEITGIMQNSCDRFSTYYRDVLVLLTNGEKNLAIKVDKVLGVDNINRIQGEANLKTIINSNFFTGVARNEKIDGEILIIDEERLIRKAEAEALISE